MAQVTTKIVGQGDANFILHVSLESDGVSGELEDYVLLDPTEFTPALPASPAVRIMTIWYSTVWFDIVLKYGGLAPRAVWTLARDGPGKFDFTKIGGLSDYSTDPPSDRDGKLLISTSDFGTPGAIGHLVIAVKKSRKA